ncbi:SAG family member [Eimeria maxima]|uniref:SAG family member n=1 Tax=Eimeria maxima TaxID=5804 RepID=U6M372_EIMMA|nr:SAG family member [Eimeria maxima]CDJ58667.1 SAG family member [Eimeria maxima]
MWHKVEESFSLKPKVTVLEAELQSYLEAINDVREVDGLNLPKFTVASGKQRLRLKKAISPSTAYEDALYNMTCAEIDASSIDPVVEGEYTIIYAVKDDKIPPTPEEAVNFWKTGYDKLGPGVPPAFSLKGDMRDEAVDGGIYYNSAVAGFASLMVDTGRTIRCYSATGCGKAALICFLSEPTLVEGKKPISDDTWEKIVALANKIQVAKREEKDNCLKEINEFRTQDSLGLSAFVAKTPTSTDATDEEVAKYDAEELAKVVTCDGLKAGNASILISSNKRSVMYYSGSSSTCANAVTEWKKGYEKFKDVAFPPKYTSSEDIYKTGAATNFISLVSEGEETVARCYTVTNCSEEGLVCVLEPAVFEEGKLPIKVVTWKKVTKTLGNGVSAPSVHGILLSSMLVVVGLFALNL